MKISRIAFSIIILGCISRLYAEPNAEPNGKDKPMTVKIEWFGHASFKISEANKVIYIDPWKLKRADHDATAVLISHSHFDHLSLPDIEKVSKGAETKIIGPADVIEQIGKGQMLKPGSEVIVGEIKIQGVPDYNPKKQFHPKANNWLGYVIEIGGKKIYYAGDTDITDEMKALKNIDLALLPAGGTYTMNSSEAAQATKSFKPKMAIPYHWGDIVGSIKDAENFKKEAACPVTILKPGGSLNLE